LREARQQAGPLGKVTVAARRKCLVDNHLESKTVGFRMAEEPYGSSMAEADVITSGK
jgi:hypothetical protein